MGLTTEEILYVDYDVQEILYKGQKVKAYRNAVETKGQWMLPFQAHQMYRHISSEACRRRFISGRSLRATGHELRIATAKIAASVRNGDVLPCRATIREKLARNLAARNTRLISCLKPTYGRYRVDRIKTAADSLDH